MYDQRNRRGDERNPLGEDPKLNNDADEHHSREVDGQYDGTRIPNPVTANPATLKVEKWQSKSADAQ
jgi:hypothetical protein